MITKRTMIFNALVALVLLTSQLGCEDADAFQDAEIDVEPETNSLYQTGAAWPNGVVDVCYDATNGNNPTLLAQARKLLENSWGQAAAITFQGWGQCNYAASTTPRSMIAIKFAADSRGWSAVGRVSPTYVGGGYWNPGVNTLELISNDTDPFQQHFRYEVIHEFGHALGFHHEQNRPDNWDSSGNIIYCDSESYNTPGGIYQTDLFDTESIMSYCMGWSTEISRGDIHGVRNVYGRNPSAHGFMIQSDRDPSLAINAWGGASHGTYLRLHNGCTKDNPDCTWSYVDGMLVSDRDPLLAINAWGGASYGTYLRLHNGCVPTNPDCTWTLKNGVFVSDRDPSLAINAWGGAVHGQYVRLHNGCSASNPDCTWTLPHVKLSSGRNTLLSVNAWGGASHGTYLRLHDTCANDNPDCTWIVSKGELRSSRDTSLAINAWGGASHGLYLRLHNGCSASNPDCTWTWSHGSLLSDTNTGLSMNAWNGAVHGAYLRLHQSCTPSNPDCVFDGLFAQP